MHARSAPHAPPGSLRIQVDARLLCAGGIGRYIREITGRWLARPDAEAIRFFGRPAELDPFLAERDPEGIAEVVPWADGPYSLSAQLRWPQLAERVSWPADVMFFPHYDVPLVRTPSPSVVCVHDLIHFQRPEGFPAWKRTVGMALMRRALESATTIVTVSESSRHAICRLMPAVAESVVVVRNGVARDFRPLTSVESVAAHRRWDHLRPFVLCVGPDKAHKNLAHAVETLARLPDTEGWRLVLVGLAEEDRDRLVAASPHAGIGSRVVSVGRVTDAELRSLYGLAAAVLVPSLLEGFGLPVLEARACGARVLVKDLSWARELAQPGVTLMPSWSALAWAGEIRALRPAVPTLARDRWGWDAAAGRTFDLLKNAAKVGEPTGPF